MPKVQFITDLPNFITREEHKVLTGTTPASFSDIPPVLQHKQERVSAVFDPGFAEFTAEESKDGTLYVIERYFSSLLSVVDGLIGSLIVHWCLWDREGKASRSHIRR